VLRSLLRKLCSYREQIAGVDSVSSNDVDRVAALNVFIVVLAFHFGQDTTQRLELDAGEVDDEWCCSIGEGDINEDSL
jgi:hypothetical protein